MTLAAVDPISVANLLLALLGGLVGGFFGALGYAYRRGRWEQKIESEQSAVIGAVRQIERRLEAGDKRFDALVRLERAAEDLTGELRATQRSIGDLVTKGECDKEHRRLQQFCDERHRRTGDGTDRG